MADSASKVLRPVSLGVPCSSVVSRGVTFTSVGHSSQVASAFGGFGYIVSIDEGVTTSTKPGKENSEGRGRGLA